MFGILANIVEIAHNYININLKPGGVAVDATVGNGKDTLFLARRVGKSGRVYGFDIQRQAVETTAELLALHGYVDNVKLFNESHELVRKKIPEPVDTVVFNLGYLPGGDHGIVTRAESTVRAVEDCLEILKPGGLICLVVYTGHPGGQKEQLRLETLLQGLDKRNFCVAKINYINRERAPYLLIIEKSARKTAGGITCENRETPENN
ncbi:MAG: 16S rRNA (cytosine(1402)-N(4))-methyltransferase [Firmicutes bacterium HGW-Firmicutes-14]|jgi:predicted O-methyltransferase YrrM|nr:MAG: 16S rRNA (cytosine(1402)-N(4))-methyltransferase [Firmicutes bacterium HGW-Firmicutes-14]